MTATISPRQTGSGVEDAAADAVSCAHGPPFIPPRVEPAARPLRFPINLFRLLTNNVAIVPRQAYEEDVVLAPGPPRIAFITGPDAVETLLQSRSGVFPKGKLQNSVLAPLMGQAMTSVEGVEWRWQRSAVAPLFRHEELLRYVPIMQAAADSLVENWRRAERGAAHAINIDMARATFAVISKTMLAGGAENVLAAIEQGHAVYFQNMNWWVVYRMLGLPYALPRPGGGAMRAYERAIREATRRIVEDRISASTRGDDLLERLLAAADPDTGRRMDAERVVDNIMAFLVAGFDTTALALSWALYLLAQSPEWAERIRNEAAAVAGEGPIGAEHLDGLAATEQVVKETLRLYPTAPIIVRDIVSDVDLAGTRLPAGTIAMLPIWAIHRHRRYWREPDAFDPTRFAADAPTKPGRFNYLPFGAGPRICIGAAFAMIECKIILASLIRAADFALAPGRAAAPTGQMFLTAGGDINLTVTLRE